MTAFDSSLSDDRLSELHVVATASLSGEASDHQIARLERLVCENDGALQALRAIHVHILELADLGKVSAIGRRSGAEPASSRVSRAARSTAR